MILWIRDHYQVPVLATLVVLGAETSLGDPVMGGELVHRHNYGCIKAAAVGPWSDSANGTVVVRGEEWWTWEDAWDGVEAWGLYISERFDGQYLRLIAADDWAGFAALYYGTTVDGFATYADDLAARAANIRRKAKEAGFNW